MEKLISILDTYISLDNYEQLNIKEIYNKTTEIHNYISKNDLIQIFDAIKYDTVFKQKNKNEKISHLLELYLSL